MSIDHGVEYPADDLLDEPDVVENSNENENEDPLWTPQEAHDEYLKAGDDDMESLNTK